MHKLGVKSWTNLSIVSHVALLVTATVLYFLGIESNLPTRHISVFLGLCLAYLLFMKGSIYKGGKLPKFLSHYYLGVLVTFFAFFSFLRFHSYDFSGAYFSFLLLGVLIPFAMMLNSESESE